MAIPSGKKLLVLIERDAAAGAHAAVYARMSSHIREAVEQQFAGAQVLENKFRSPSIFTAAVGNGE